MPPALSPLDGRYAAAVEPYAAAFSEDALIRQRFRVEVEWLLTLAARAEITELPDFAPADADRLRSWVVGFGPDDVAAVKALEATTNHDVKAVEYLLKERLVDAGLGPAAEFTHFACTSEDINNLAYTLMLRDGLHDVWLPAADGLVGEVWGMAEAHATLAMPGHTHGQPATPTTLGKELAVHVWRWRRQLDGIRGVRLLAKCNGATGTYGAHQVAYPEVPWIEVSRTFVEGFGLVWNPLTTQIESHDALAEVLHGMVRWNTVLLDYCRDMWEYVSRGMLRQQTVAGEVGSSTMLHKVNPIDFENAEANVGISTALAEHLATKLMVSRMQRDLSDSSAIRNVGMVLGHSGLAIRSARRGLARVAPDTVVLAAVLDGQWEVVGEAVQTVMRRHGLATPYERLKELTRGTAVGRGEMAAFVRSLDLPSAAEARLLALTPATYVGLAPELVAYAAPGAARPRRRDTRVDRVHVDLNADLGEGYGAWTMGDDEALLGVVTSANVACGYHAGDPTIMRTTCRRAVERGVAVGAHVAYRDLAGFGRRAMDVAPATVRDEVLYQVAALSGVAAAVGGRVRYVKAHGALYNRAADDADCAAALVAATAEAGDRLALVGLPGSVLLAAAAEAGVPVVAEAYLDRAYRSDGRLVARTEAGAVIRDPAAIARRAVALVADGTVPTVGGEVLALHADSLCLHGDTPGALEAARAVRRALEDAGVHLVPATAGP